VEFSGLRLVALTDLALFVRVVVDVVELRSWRLDVFPVMRPDRVQRAPSEIEQGSEGLRIQIAVGQRGSRARRPEIDAVGIEWCDAEQAHHRRRDVDERYAIVDGASARDTRSADDERHAQRRVVDEDAVADLTVLAECLPMIGCGHDHG
jgi:hypothetical protein